jgi:predicted  nucleic acid-binding Zn-ribbon protein
MTTENQNSKKNKLIIPIIILLGLSVGANIFQAVNNSVVQTEQLEQIDSLSIKTEEINNLYTSSLDLVDGLRSDSIELSDELKLKVEEIQKIKESNENLKATIKDKDELNRRLSYNLNLIKGLNKDLEKEVKKLKEENKVLTEKNTQLTNDVDSLAKSNAELTEKVNVAERLRVEYLKPVAQRERFFNDEFKETDRAKRTKKIDISFSVLKNDLAKEGERTVYVRLIAPTGEIMGNGEMRSGNFIAEAGDTLNFSMKKEFTYNNDKQDLMLSYSNMDNEFPEGKYEIEIYVGGYKSASTSIELE